MYHQLLLFLTVIVYSTGQSVGPSQVVNLPGAPPVTFKHYAGYLNAGSNRYLHYWFVESQRSPSSDPLLIWLTGGPGCSSLGALLTEWGPFRVNPDGATLSINPYAWNREANVLAIESPAGVGFSYSSNNDVSNNDNRTANENYNALKDFFAQFPQYRSNDFYVTGESYGGIYVPTLVQTILDHQSDYNINIRGLAIGNGCVSQNIDFDTIIQFLYNHNMVDELEWSRVKTDCCNGSIDGCAFHTFTTNGYCRTFARSTANFAWNSGINPYGMYFDCASENRNGPAPIQTRYQIDRMRHQIPSFAQIPCMNETAVTTYYNRPDVRAALFVNSRISRWDFCSTPVSFAYDNIYGEMLSRVQYAVTSGLRVMIYNGDTDLACNSLMGQRFSAALGFTKLVNKRSYTVNNQIGGFYTAYQGVEYYSVRGAGHMVPTDKADVSFYILQSFLNNRRP